ncbi:hypothetical protein [[Erwinia] mediterraneensis]|uniref:hypothetical protein n=1 Tax=[Erwinia] mediterraneensis TaxID=2161819 RepID=UPI00102FC790|nr:hypothetical protein [[Erwinia] mediterraneensis]
MASASLNDVNFNLESLEVAAIEICKTKGMLGLLLNHVPTDIQHSYFQRLKDAGLDDELVWLQQIVDAR